MVVNILRGDSLFTCCSILCAGRISLSLYEALKTYNKLKFIKKRIREEHKKMFSLVGPLMSGYPPPPLNLSGS